MADLPSFMHHGRIPIWVKLVYTAFAVVMIRVPICQAPVGSIAGLELAAAVLQAGSLGERVVRLRAAV